MTLTRTHTHTYTKTKCHAWAETLPWTCLVRPTRCCSPTHGHTPMVNDPCAHPDCDELLVENEVCYAVIESGGWMGESGRELWVCWRHVVDEHEDLLTGPIVVP